MTDREKLSQTERAVVDCVVQEGRANAALVAEQTAISTEKAERTLTNLVSEGLLEEVSDDLYQASKAAENTAKAQHHGIPDPNPDTQTAPIDPTEVDENE